MIIIADQHAVDERIMLEKMLKSVFGSAKQPVSGNSLAPNNGIMLSPPRRLELSSSEAVKAMMYRSDFNRWNIDFNFIPEAQLHTSSGTLTPMDSKHFRQLRSASKYFGKHSSKPVNTGYIEVTKIPRVISDRCATNPALLSQIICDHIAWIESQCTSKHGETHGCEDADFSTWNHHLRDCPRGIIEILKSKSCRSAIMFNDVLTRQQCQKLVDLVSECVYPFQCAHGRY